MVKRIGTFIWGLMILFAGSAVILGIGYCLDEHTLITLGAMGMALALLVIVLLIVGVVQLVKFVVSGIRAFISAGGHLLGQLGRRR